MSTDRELLELAAKAAGIEIRSWRDEPFCAYIGPCLYWNPLTDGGDALRLAVKLNLHLGLESNVANAWQGGTYGWYSEGHNTDPYAATRRAIVRAAAGIGEKMK
ncbi:MAG: hypothetical protein WC073_11485 [Sterolibacterium sp.]